MLSDYRAEFKTMLNKYLVRNELTELLNILTIYNYTHVKLKILDIIKSNTENRIKFLEKIFAKAVSEKYFVSLYAKIFNDLDRELSQYNKKDRGMSQMRTYLLGKSREFFITDIYEIDKNINLTTHGEGETKIKKLLLCHAKFFEELIISEFENMKNFQIKLEFL